MSPDLRLCAAAIERAHQRVGWALASVVHGSVTLAEIEIDRARAALESARVVLSAETSESHRQITFWGGER